METTVNYCAGCGQMFEAGFSAACPRCELVQPADSPLAAAQTPAQIPAQQQGRDWGVGTGLLTWAVSVALLFGTQFIAVIIYLVMQTSRNGSMPKVVKIDWLLGILSVAAAFPAHLLTLAFCWFIVTGRGRRPFLQTLGWNWHPQFKWVHATALAFMMMGIALLFAKILPHQETELEKLLKLGMGIKIMTALLAVFSAPLVEEIVYRGILYPGVERQAGWIAGVAVTTLLFAAVHVPQYWGSWAAITTILFLSLVLTVLRAVSGSVLPGIATHFVYNGIQAVGLLLGLDDSVKQNATETARHGFTQVVAQLMAMW